MTSERPGSTRRLGHALLWIGLAMWVVLGIGWVTDTGGAQSMPVLRWVIVALAVVPAILVIQIVRFVARRGRGSGDGA